MLKCVQVYVVGGFRETLQASQSSRSVSECEHGKMWHRPRKQAGACMQVYVVGGFRETLQIGASGNTFSLTANLSQASLAPSGFLAAIDMNNGSTNWTAQYAGQPSEVHFILSSQLPSFCL